MDLYMDITYEKNQFINCLYIPISNDIRQNIRETQNIKKSMVKKKKERQCLPMARRQCKKRGRKEETHLMDEAHKRNEAREK